MPETLDIVRMTPPKALKKAGGKTRNPGGVPSDSGALKRVAQGRSEDPVPF